MDYKTVLTTCAYCGCGCGLYLEVLDGRLVGTLPSKTNPINHEFVQHPDRITKPLIRKNGALTEASWDEALDYTASRLKEIKEAHGSDSIAFLASAKVTNEENYLIMKFARAAVGTNNVDHCARL
jgi:predicted molibdopterin-dependent oxidoreductase YjgC